MRKKLRNFGIRTKNEESRNKQLMKVNKRLMEKIRVIENKDCENKVIMCKNASSKGIKKENIMVVVDVKENLKKELFEIKKKYETREKKLNKEILRKEGIINRLHEKKYAANKKLKEDEVMKENVVENLKKENSLLKKENKELSNKNYKLKSENKETEIENKKTESEIKQLYEDRKRLENEIVEFKMLVSSKRDKTESMKQKLEALNEVKFKENNLLKNENKILRRRVETS